MSYKSLLIFALVAGSPAVAAAQFTTFIPQQNKVADSVAAVVAVQQKVQADSIVNTRLTNIKTWVDSAAGTVSVPVTTAADSSHPSTAAAVSSAAASSDTMLTNGRRAPLTASALPLLLLAGAAGFGVGLFLLAGSREPARARREDRRA